MHKIDTFIVINFKPTFWKTGCCCNFRFQFYAAKNSLVHECFVDWQCICINTFWFNCTVCILGIWKKTLYIPIKYYKASKERKKIYFILFNVISGFAGTYSFAFHTSFDDFCTKCNKLPNHQVKNKVSSHLLACMVPTCLEDKLSYS